MNNANRSALLLAFAPFALVACAPLDDTGNGDPSTGQNPIISGKTTKTALLANNTSGSSLFTDSYTPAARFHGSSKPVSSGDAQPGSVKAASLTQGAVSKVSIHSLLGASTPVFVETQSWFCTGGASPLSSGLGADQCGSHADIGYASNSSAQVHTQVADMRSRGIDGVLVDWQGKSAGLGLVDKATTSDPAINTGALGLYKAEAEASGGAFKFAVMEDEGITSCAAAAGCDVTAAVEGDLDFLATHFFDSPAYLHQNGRPVVMFFSLDTTVAKHGKSIDWAHVRAHVQKDPLLVFENAGGFGHAEGDGAYSWLHSQDIGSYPGSDPFGVAGFLPYFYKQAAANPSKITWGSAWKGFDDNLVNGWGGGRRYAGQQCGKTWLDTLATTKSHGAGLSGVQIATWDDYEEGTEVETGIDNHVAVSASVSGAKLSWSLAAEANAPSDCTGAVAQGLDLATTLHHLAVYASSDGEDLELVADNLAPTAKSLDLGALVPAGATQLFVYAVGQPMIHNHLSAPVAYSAPVKCGAPTVLEPTAGESVGPAIRLRVKAPACVTSLVASVDGKSVAHVATDTLDVWVPVSMGKHTVTVTGGGHAATPVTFKRTY